MKNTGKISEGIFEQAWMRVGKRAHVFRFTDSAEARGTNRKAVYVKPQPADYLLTFDGATSLAEVKSTLDPDKFVFSLLRATQSAFAAFHLAAGGTYDVYIHSLAHDAWYRVPYAVLRDHSARHMKWPELQEYRWTFPM